MKSLGFRPHADFKAMAFGNGRKDVAVGRGHVSKKNYSGAHRVFTGLKKSPRLYPYGGPKSIKKDSPFAKRKSFT
jgi:hypothetical protein